MFFQNEIDRTISNANIIDGEQTVTATLPYAVPALDLDDGPVLYSYFGFLLSYITPHDIALGETISMLMDFLCMYVCVIVCLRRRNPLNDDL